MRGGETRKRRARYEKRRPPRPEGPVRSPGREAGGPTGREPADLGPQEALQDVGGPLHFALLGTHDDDGAGEHRD